MDTGAAPNSSGARQTRDHAEDGSGVEWGRDCSAGCSSRDGRAYVDAEDNLKFYPPLYLQRYETVSGILKDERWSPPLASVVEFGCAQLAMFPYFKNISHVEKLLMVDIDFGLLDYYGCRAAPLSCDYLSPRESPLHVEVLCGSVADCDVRLLGANAVVCIELIEHLELDVVDKLGKTIFGFMEPEIAIFTTPNSDFNVLLKGMKGKFRHYDHKFEWSRSEFKNWTSSITSQYPHYRVEISGVGTPPEGSNDVGPCSQLALFIRSDSYTPTLNKSAQEIYRVCSTYDHPVKKPDPRTDEERLRDEIDFRLHRMAYSELYQSEEDGDFILIPLLELAGAVQYSIPTASVESIRCILPSEDVVEKDGDVFVTFRINDGKSDSSLDSGEEENIINYETVPESSFSEEQWDDDTPPVLPGPRFLNEYHMALATFDNAANLAHEETILQRGRTFDGHNYRCRFDDDDEDFDDDDYEEDENDDEEYSSDEDGRDQLHDCERLWNSSIAPKPSLACNEEKEAGSAETGTSKSGTFSSACGSEGAASSPPCTSEDQENLILSSKREPITDSGVDLSPLLNVSYPHDEMIDTFPGLKLQEGACAPSKSKELPKSTSVEVLHLDGSCTLKRRAGLEYVEFAPATSVALCYTGQTYCPSDKILEKSNMSVSSERKSLDGSLVRDVADSYSLDFAGDSGYPNSSSLHHDVDVDLTPEQVDDISSENDERSNQSLSEDELSDSSDRGPALPRRVIHPRHPIIPIVFENVENGDLANNNRDGEGNNAVAPQGDEREFIALVQEGDMQPLLAAPVADDIILPNNADPFPDWLMDLLRIEDGDQLPPVKMAEELENDEGLGDDSM